MTLSSVSSNVNVAQVNRKQGEAKPASDSPQDVAESVAAQGQSEIARAQQLRDQAAALKALASQQAANADAKIQGGQAKEVEGAQNIVQSAADQASNMAKVNDGFNNEQAATANANAGVASYQQSLGEATTAHQGIKEHIQNDALGIIAEKVGSHQLSGSLNTLGQQLADAQGPRGDINTGIGGLKAGIATEQGGAATVKEGLADHANASALYEEGSNELRDGKEEANTAKNTENKAKDKDSRAAIQTANAATQNEIGDNKKADSDAANQQAQDDWNTSGQLFADSDAHAQASTDQQNISELLAKLADIDNNAAQSLIAIPSFSDEGNKTLVDSQIKSCQSEARHQDAETQADVAQALSDEGNIYVGKATDGWQQATVLAAKAAALKAAAVVNSAAAAVNSAAAQQLHDQAAQLGAEGDAKQTEGSAKRDQAAAGINAADAKIEGGFATEKAGADAQAAATPGIAAGQTALDANADARNNTIAAASDNADQIGAALDYQGQETAAIKAGLDGVNATVAPRAEALAGITIAQKQRSDAFQAQSDGLNGLEASDALFHAGTDKVIAGHHDVRQGTNAKAVAEEAIGRADQQDAAGQVIADKGQKYVDAANALLETQKKA